MSKPQRLCSSCQCVALTGSRFCKFHARQRTTARSQRAVAVRMEKWLPENRSLEGVIALPQLDSAASIVVAVNSIIRALQKRRIDPARAGMLAYALQTSYNACRMTSRNDPAIRLAARALSDLNLELTWSKTAAKHIQGGAPHH